MWQYNYTSNELYHYGVLGMKWGHRKNKYYNSDGSLTSLGKKRDEYKALKKEGKTGYREYLGSPGYYAVWTDKKTFNRTVNANKKKALKNANGFKEKMKIRQSAKKYKRRVEIDNMLAESMYNNAAKQIKDSMKAEIKGVPVSKVRKGRERTERVLATAGTLAFATVGMAGLIYLEDKLGR